MSKVLSVSVPHRLGAQAAKQRIAEGIPLFEPTFGRAATLEETGWNENTLSFTIRAMGVRAPGTIVVAEDAATVEAHLPVVLIPFAGQAESLIQKHGAELLAGDAGGARQLTPDRKQEIRRRARKAAQAAGQDWSQLSQEERKSFRQQARRDIA